MTQKKSAPKTAATGSAGTELNELYTAHQVHTLVHLMYQHLMTSRQTGHQPSSPLHGPGGAVSQGPGWSPNPAPAAGFVAHGSPHVVYWYP